jgi:hypothetical protein
LLKNLNKQVASRVDDQLCHESKSVGATALITEGLERSGCVFRVAHIFFGLEGIMHAGDFLFGVTDDKASDSDDDSVVPAVAHWKRATDNMSFPFRA